MLSNQIITIKAPMWCSEYQCQAGVPRDNPESLLCDKGLCTASMCCDGIFFSSRGRKAGARCSDFTG